MKVPSALESPSAITVIPGQNPNLITRIPVQLGEGGEVTQVYYTLDGSTSYISSDFDPSTIGTGDISISCWLRVDTVPSGTKYVWILGNDNLDNSLSLRIRSTKLEVFGRVGTEDEIEVTAANTIVPDLWTHVVVTRTGTTIELFVNGTSNASGTNSEAAANLSDGETWIGYHIGSSSFAGDFANFEIRNAVLTDSEIYDNFNAGTAYTTGTEQTQTLTPTNTTTTNSNLPADWNNLWGFDFDGVNDHITIPDSDNLSFGNGGTDDPFSIEVWVKMEDTNRFRIITKLSTTSAYEYLFATDGSDRLTLYLLTTNTNFIRAYTTANLTAYQSTWTHLVATYDGSKTFAGITLYINGVSQAVTDGSAGTYTGMVNTTYPVEIGRYGTSSYAFGKMDELIIHDKELSSGEVATRYNSGTPSDPRSLSLRYYLHEATGADWSGNNELATLQSGAEITANVPVVTLPDWENSHSLDFNGSSAYVSTSFNAATAIGSGDFTLSGWFKLDTLAANHTLFSFSDDTNDDNDTFRIQYSTGLGFRVNLKESGGGYNNIYAAESLSAEVWYHFAVTRSGQDVNIYINAGTPTSDTNVNNDHDFSDAIYTYMGRVRSSISPNLNGHLAHPAIWNTALDAAAIAKLASEPIDLTQDDGNYDNSSDLVAYWPFISGAGAGALDHSGNSNHGVIIAPNWSTDVPGVTPITNTYSIDLNGTNQYMEANALASVVSSDNVGSFSAWIAPTDASPNNAETIMGFGDANADSKLEIHITGITQTLVRVSCSIAGTIQWLLSSSDLGWTNGVWHHVTVTHDGSTAKLYIDGVDISAGYTVTTDKTAWLTDITGIDTFCVGATNKNSAVTQYFDGLIDEAAYFSTELSAAQVTAIYNSGVPANLAPYSPVGWYRMGDNDGGTGTTITDQGSGGNDGTLTNAPTFSTNVPT